MDIPKEFFEFDDRSLKTRHGMKLTREAIVTLVQAVEALQAEVDKLKKRKVGKAVKKA